MITRHNIYIPRCVCARACVCVCVCVCAHAHTHTHKGTEAHTIAGARQAHSTYAAPLFLRRDDDAAKTQDRAIVIKDEREWHCRAGVSFAGLAPDNILTTHSHSAQQARGKMGTQQCVIYRYRPTRQRRKSSTPAQLGSVRSGQSKFMSSKAGVALQPRRARSHREEQRVKHQCHLGPCLFWLREGTRGVSGCRLCPVFRKHRDSDSKDQDRSRWQQHRLARPHRPLSQRPGLFRLLPRPRCDRSVAAHTAAPRGEQATPGRAAHTRVRSRRQSGRGRGAGEADEKRRR